MARRKQVQQHPDSKGWVSDKEQEKLHDDNSIKESLVPTPDQVNQQMNKSVVISKAVVFKLLLFSLLMFIVPISCYYLTIYFEFSTTIGGIVAATMANVVAGSYVVVAFTEKD